MRKSLAVALGSILVLCLLVPSIASAQEQGDPRGTYVGTVTGASGKTFEAWAQLGPSRLGFVIVTVKVADKPSLPIPIRPNWTSPTSFTVSKYLWVPGLVDGSGSATWTQEGDTWTVAGNGSGSVSDGPEGSATGQGVRVSSEFVEPPLNAGPINDTGGGKTTGGTDVERQTDTAQSALVAVGSMEQSPQPSDGGQAEAGLSSAAMVIAGVILCIFLGASMSGSEFAELWNAPEGSES